MRVNYREELSHRFTTTNASIEWHEDLSLFNFYAVKKEQQNDKQQKAN